MSDLFGSTYWETQKLRADEILTRLAVQGMPLKKKGQHVIKLTYEQLTWLAEHIQPINPRSNQQ